MQKSSLPLRRPRCRHRRIALHVSPLVPLRICILKHTLPSVRSIRAHRGTPVLIADGWKIYHRGISWKIRYSHGYREEDDSVVCGDLLLGIEPPDGLEINSKPMMNPIPS